MDEIFHHPWDEQKQKQKELRRSQAMDKYGGIEVTCDIFGVCIYALYKASTAAVLYWSFFIQI